MTMFEALLAPPYGGYVAILLMTAATYLCRASGVIFMSRVRIGPRLARALRALPGSIVVGTVLPVAAQSGAPAFIGVAAAVAVMATTRIEVLAMAAGLAGVAAARALGL